MRRRCQQRLDTCQKIDGRNVRRIRPAAAREHDGVSGFQFLDLQRWKALQHVLKVHSPSAHSSAFALSRLRWRTARAASKLHTVLLDVSELTERADNAIKFLSDMFSARLYKLCAAKVGVPDYKDLVKEKLQTAEDLYRFMVEQFNQSRAFILELMVVVILIIELIYFFKGRPI